MTAKDENLRDMFLEIIMGKRGCDRAEAEVIMQRTADRLAGYTHGQAVTRRPLPPGRDEACGTTAEARRG
jgi:hypothetical protein